jgi:hypothetical protein
MCSILVVMNAPVVGIYIPLDVGFLESVHNAHPYNYMHREKIG